MAVKSFRPITPSRRQMTVATFDELTTDKPERSLIAPLKKRAGRNHQGRMTVRHQGGGHKRMYRIIDFKRNKDGVPAKVATIEYDPNRTCYIALLNYVDGEKRYILAPNGLKVGDTVVSGPEADIKIGNALPLANIPVGSIVHNIELKPKKGGQIVRSGFICGFIELYPGGLEDLGGILAAPDGDQCIGLAVHKELGRLDSGSALGLGRWVWDDGVIPVFPEQEIGRAGQDDAHVLFIFIQWDCDLHELPPP